MEGARAAIAAVLLPAALAAAGCCGLRGDGTSARFNRDTPEGAFDFVRAAYAEDRTRDQYDSFHKAFRDSQGISEGKYSLAYSLRPGLFEKAKRIIGKATLESIEHGAEPVEIAPGKSRRWARVTIRTPEGRGVFVLVDEPTWLLVTADDDLGALRGSVEDPGRSVRVEGDELVVEYRTKLAFPPEPGKEAVRRFEIHHDWQLYGVEELEGFDEFLGEVRKTDEEAAKKGSPQ